MKEVLDFIIAKIKNDKMRNLTTNTLTTEKLMERNEVYKEVIDFLKECRNYAHIFKQDKE